MLVYHVTIAYYKGLSKECVCVVMNHLTVTMTVVRQTGTLIILLQCVWASLTDWHRYYITPVCMGMAGVRQISTLIVLHQCEWPAGFLLEIWDTTNTGRQNICSTG